jgi:hypothetical protein
VLLNSRVVLADDDEVILLSGGEVTDSLLQIEIRKSEYGIGLTNPWSITSLETGEVDADGGLPALRFSNAVLDLDLVLDDIPLLED